MVVIILELNFGSLAPNDMDLNLVVWYGSYHHTYTHTKVLANLPVAAYRLATKFSGYTVSPPPSHTTRGVLVLDTDDS